MTSQILKLTFLILIFILIKPCFYITISSRQIFKYLVNDESFSSEIILSFLKGFPLLEIESAPLWREGCYMPNTEQLLN